MNIAFCSSEMASLAKVGGLADVTESLPKAMRMRGENICVFLPLYKQIKDERGKELRDTGVEFSSWMDGGNRLVHLWEINVHGVPVFLIEHDPYFMRDHPYGTPHGDYPDNPYRFALFSKAVLEAIVKLGLNVDVIHCNDWETSLVPLYHKFKYNDEPSLKRVGTLFTIHNLAYQGVFQKDVLPKIGLDWSLFHMDALEYYGNINYLKGGILFSDIVNTVSPTYAQEIQTRHFGYGLDGVLRKRSQHLFGVINGIDYEEWNPATDSRIYENYSVDSLEGKRKNKKMLQKDEGLAPSDGPLMGMVGRLVEQKGIELLHVVLGDVVSMGTQVIVLGSGEERYHDMLLGLQERYKDSVSINIGYDDVLAARIYAGCDLFAMPSRYEPCGLGQMISLRYGTIPVVRATGGLADTIQEYDPETGEGNGFLFRSFKPGEFLKAIERAYRAYQLRDKWESLIKKAMGLDFSWGTSAQKYLELYQLAISMARER